MSKHSSNGNVVTCSSGVSLGTRPISVKVLEWFDLSHQKPEPPMVEATTIGGETEMVPNPDDAVYKELLAGFNRKSTDDFLAMILDLGVDFQPPEDTGWVRTLKRAGVSVPDDPDEQRLMYIQTFVMLDFLEDLRSITSAVLRQSGVSEEAIASWTNLF